MRTVNATLLTQQKTLHGKPCVSAIIGAGTTIDVSTYVIEYEYEEAGREAGLTLVLDNSAGTFNSLTGSYAPITAGAQVDLARGITVDGTDYTDELPRCWIETISYDYADGQAACILECIDFWGKLARWSATTEQTWTSTQASTILSWLLTQVSLTLEAGSMTSFALNFALKLRETGYQATRRLVRKMPEYLHAGQNGVVKWREIDGDEASAYTFGWNAQHPLLEIEAGSSAWAINSITVKGRNASTGSASDATQIAAVGTRKWTIYDNDLVNNTVCAQRAQAELDLFEANAVEALLLCRPCHGLELYDVVTVDNPPWGGADVVGRVIQWSEHYEIDGNWYQRLYLGDVPRRETAPTYAAWRRLKGKKAATKKKKSTGRRSSSSYAAIRRRVAGLDDRLDDIEDALWGPEAILPVGVILLWSGAVDAVPAGWALCDGANGTPNLSGCFVVGAGDNGVTVYAVGDTGGADSADLSHTHTISGASASAAGHTHGSGTLATDTQAAHSHGYGTLATDNDTHTHGIDWNEVGIAYTPGGSAFQDPTEIIVNNDTHNHNVTSGSTGTGGSHDHTVNSGATASGGSHSHDPGTLANSTAGSATQDIRPTFYALAYIMRIE